MMLASWVMNNLQTNNQAERALGTPHIIQHQSYIFNNYIFPQDYMNNIKC